MQHAQVALMRSRQTTRHAADDGVNWLQQPGGTGLQPTARVPRVPAYDVAA